MSQAHNIACRPGERPEQDVDRPRGPANIPLPTLCPFLFQNKVVTVDGARVKLQVRAVAGMGEGLALASQPEPQARSPALSLG